MIGIYYAKHRDAKEHGEFLIFNFIALAEALVGILTLGLFTCEWRANFLFRNDDVWK